ncbi:CUB and sushi domain-containing protein 3, partial [Araneus ventricosus]
QLYGLRYDALAGISSRCPSGSLQDRAPAQFRNYCDATHNGLDKLHGHHADSDHCDLPPTIPHGVAKGDKEGDYYRPYDEVVVLCQSGYRYSGSTEYIMCEEETGWEEEFEECVESFCGPPEPLANGTIPEIESSNMTVYPFNFELTYICDKGFRLIGDSWRFCDSRGWSGKSPSCEAIYCPDPGVPEHGTRIGNSFEIGDKVTFSCFTGFELIGSFERYCMPNGQWNNELARCDHSSNYCPDPGIPVNGMKNSSSYDMGEIVRFSCYGGYTLVGSEVRECLPSRQWSGEEAKCFGKVFRYIFYTCCTMY